MFCEHTWPDLHRPILADEVISALWITPTELDDYLLLIEQARQDCNWDRAERWSDRIITLYRTLQPIPGYPLGLAEIYRGSLFHTMGRFDLAAESYKTAYNTLHIGQGPQWRWNAAVALFGLGLVSLGQAKEETIKLLSESVQTLEQVRGLHDDEAVVNLVTARLAQATTPVGLEGGLSVAALETPVLIETTDFGEGIVPIRIPTSDIMPDRVRLNGRVLRSTQIGTHSSRRDLQSGRYAYCARDNCQQDHGIVLGDYILFSANLSTANPAPLTVLRVDLPHASRVTVAQVERCDNLIQLKAKSSSCTRPIMVFARNDPRVSILGEVLAVLKSS